VPPALDKALVTVDRRGRVSSIPAPPRSYYMVRVSPDGRRLAVTIKTLTEVSLWLYDLGRGTLTPLTMDGEAFSLPVWTPDGQRLVFAWLKDGRTSLATQPADAPPGVAPQVLVNGELDPSSFTPDGRTLAVGGIARIELVTIDGEKATVQPLFQAPPYRWWPAFSPDGRWLAYASDVSGRFEVYVQPYPGPGAPKLVSIDGGDSPAWHPNGRELFYLGYIDPTAKCSAGSPGCAHRMMAAEFEPGSPPRIGTPRELFPLADGLGFFGVPWRGYDVAPPDGQRFYVVKTLPLPPSPVVTHIKLIQNWLEELKANVPVR
jgi:Tol biopolymer transport system component